VEIEAGGCSETFTPRQSIVPEVLKTADGIDPICATLDKSTIGHRKFT
jgi:hypothetical protein